MRPDGAHQFRERGGSRPGLGNAIRTRVGTGPIRLLTKVPILTNSDDRVYYYVTDRALTDQLTTISGTPTYATDSITGLGVFTGTDYTIGVPAAKLWSTNPTNFQLSLGVLPNGGNQLEGIVKIQFWYTTSATQDGFSAELTFAGGIYSSAIREYVSGSQANAWFPGQSWTDRPNEPGRFVVQIVGSTAYLYFRNQLMQTQAIGSSHGVEAGFDVDSSDGSIRVEQWNTEYNDSSNTDIAANQRRDLLVAVANGNLYVEDYQDTLTQVVPPDPFEDVQLCADSREQLLYIADYGSSVTGTLKPLSGGPPPNLITDSGQNFTTSGIDTNYVLEIYDSDYSVNEKQTITITGATGGTWTFTFESNTSSALNHNATATNVKDAFTALGYTTTVTGTNPWIVEFQGNRAEQDVSLVTLDTTNLTGTVTSSVSETQAAGNNATFNGTFPITGVTATTITFTPSYTLTPVGSVNVSYRLAKPPKVFDPSDNSISNHTAETNKGFVPAGARLVVLYRDRITYAATDALPHVWYMSRQGNPNDWDYTQNDDGAAVYAQSSIAGQLADPITALINHSDECLIFGCYNSLWILRGDPGLGGVVDQLSHKIGIVGCDAYCKTPDDMCVFMSPDGLYVMPAGCHGMPTSLSRERIPDELLGLTETREHVSLEFDTMHRGVHIMVTKQDGTEGRHWWFDWESKSFWRVKLQNDHEPFAMHERTSWDDSIRVLIGGRDGWIRYFDRKFYTDDGSNIDSYVMLGPFGIGTRDDLREGILTEMHGTTGKNSTAVTWDIYAGDSYEDATTNGPKQSGTWNTAGYNYTNRPRVRGLGAVLKLSATSKWLMENIRAVFKVAGKTRKR